jgi:hypothetical protein
VSGPGAVVSVGTAEFGVGTGGVFAAPAAERKHGKDRRLEQQSQDIDQNRRPRLMRKPRPPAPQSADDKIGEAAEQNRAAPDAFFLPRFRFHMPS